MAIRVASRAIAVEFDERDGRLVGIENLARGLQLVVHPPTRPPFRIELEEGDGNAEATEFHWSEIGGGARLTWRVAPDLVLQSDVVVRSDEITFILDVTNRGRGTLSRVEYPIISGIGRLGGPGQDELVHSHATGMLFHDPLDLFEPDPENRRRLRYSAYPEGFSGSTMQMMAYYARGRGGFFIGTEDPGRALKGYNFFKDGDHLCASIMHQAPTVTPGAALTPGYPVVIGALTRGDWYEAADRYKHWAVAQPWAQAEPRSRWLREQVGICTFGVNASHDRSAWLDRFHQVAGTPVFHVLGPNWPKYGQDYQNHFPRGRQDWFPASFHPANLAAIRRNGDFWAPFEFDLLCNHAPEYTDPVLASRVVPKAGESDPSAPRFPYMCAGTDYWHDLHVWRDRTLVASHDCDALYYDISVSNLLMQCRATNHNHAPGAGTAIADAFTTMYRDTKAVASAAKGAYVPSGTEVISECFLRDFDYYQARAEACPLAPFEVDCFRHWIVAGRAEKIPLFTYVYHERGPLRLDGWAKLSREAGDLFYLVAARVLLNGGLLELNYEFSGLETLENLTDDPAEHYYPFVPRPYAADPAKEAFVGEVARARVGPANPFLAYGTMLPAPTVDAPTIDLGYFLYNVFPGRTFEERGRVTAPSVIATAWQHQGRAVWIAANVSSDAQTVRIDGKPVTIPPRKIATIVR